MKNKISNFFGFLYHYQGLDYQKYQKYLEVVILQAKDELERPDQTAAKLNKQSQGCKFVIKNMSYWLVGGKNMMIY